MKNQQRIIEERKAIAFKPIWSKPDLAWLLGISEKKVERMVKFDGLPCSALPNEKGNTRFQRVFRRAAVLQWLKERETVNTK